MTVTSIDLSNQVAVAQLAFAIMLLAFAIFMFGFNRTDKSLKNKR